MKLRVNEITEKERRITASEPASAYPGLARVQNDGECTFLSPVDVDLTVVKEYGHIRVKGTVVTRVGLSCSRCLVDFLSDIHSGFTIYFTQSSGEQIEDEVELAEEDLLSVTYNGEEIDLANEIAEQVLLELPYKPLCSENCKGLCPECGIDLNNSKCDCSNSLSKLPFSSLKGFKVNK